jgi:dTMP kinase
MFVAFEGGEGTGKSTQARLLAERLGPDCVLTREPGGTSVGETLRRLVLDDTDARLTDRTEALLFAAARAQHAAEVLRPALAAGRHVITDRYIGSSLAYQGAGRELGVDAVRAINAFATDDLWPDAVVLLTVPPAVRDARLAERGRTADKLESEAAAFHAAVEAAFLDLAAADPTWTVVDGSGSVDEVAALVWDRLSILR